MYVVLMNKQHIKKLTYSAICLALCLVLPFLTGQIPQIGSALCPMHLPVLLAGFLCGPWWAAAVGLIAPLLRHAIFAMPPLLTAIAMSFELLTYGLITGICYRLLPRKTSSIYISLIAAMIAGRLVWAKYQGRDRGLNSVQTKLYCYGYQFALQTTSKVFIRTRVS